jgi:capsule polysaccharide export protein KpsE/RkpR
VNPIRAPFGEDEREASFLTEPSAEDIKLSRERTISRLRLLWANRGFLARVFLVSLAVSTLGVFLIPNRYEAVTKIMPPDNAAGAGMAMISSLIGGTGTNGRSAAIGGMAGDLLGLKTTGALFQGILSSRTVQDRLIQQFELQKLYRDAKIEDARKDLSQHTDISEDRKSGIITVSVSDHDPKRAAAMATAYVHELDKLVAEVSTSSARRERIFLEGRLQTVKGDLESAAKNFSDFASKNTAIDIPAQGKAMVEAAAILQGQLIAAQSELSGLQQIYADGNVRVRSAQARVDELKKKLAEYGGEGTPKTLMAENSMYPSIRKLPLLGVTWADLYRENKVQETVYELLTQQFEMAKVQEAKEIPTVKVLDVAVVPTKKTFPPRPLLVALSTVFCVALAAAGVFVKRRWSGIAPEDPTKQFLGEIVQALQADAAHLAPQGSFLRRVVSRNGARRHDVAGGTPESQQQPSEQSPEVARVARNST